MNISVFVWDPPRVFFTIPYFQVSVAWYGAFFAIGFIIAYYLFVYLLEKMVAPSLIINQKLLPYSSRKLAVKITDKLLLYVAIGTFFGAKIGHYLFYEDPFYYLKHPLLILKYWREGLASHGAAWGILLSVVFFQQWLKKQLQLHWFTLLDLMCIPAALIGSLIRLGNFFNQEILGTFTNKPWAVLFLHPYNGSSPFPRHPVQLYESFFYFFLFFFLFYLFQKTKIMREEGKLIGLFFILTFSFRFVIEFFKEEQSSFFLSTLKMGQILSVPFILLGFLLFFQFPRKFFFHGVHHSK